MPTKPGDGIIHVIAEIRAKSGSEDAVRAMLVQLVPAARKENGCQRYELFEDQKAPGTFYTEEEWADQAALDEHLKRVAPVVEQATPHLASELRITPFKQLA